MEKKIGFLLLLLLTLCACARDESALLEKQLAELEELGYQAIAIKNALQDKTGEEYLSEHDKYHDIMLERAVKARKYLDKADPAKLTRNELMNLAQIAEISQDEQKIIEITKTIFDRFPDTKADRRLCKLYFPNAYLLEPDEIEKYVDLEIFTPNDRLECYYALALGFAEAGNSGQAEKYNTMAYNFMQQLLAEGIQRNTIPVIRLTGLRSFIEYKLGRPADAYKIIDEAKATFSDEYSRKQLELFENRLKILGKEAKAIEYQFWVGTEQPLDLAALHGKVVLLDFFTWNCEACTLSLPSLFDLQEQCGKDFMIVGVTQYTNDQSASELREYEYLRDQYYEHRELQWPVSITRSDFMDDYGISTYPVYLLIDKDGIVRDGYYISNFAYLKKEIQALLED